MITDIRIYPSINSKGEISVKVGVKTESGLYYASVPSGTSKGSSEAKEISFEKARKIFPKLRHRIIGTQEDFERVDRMLREIDRTQNFSKIGGNLALGISIAVARAQSKGELWKLKGLGDEQKFPIPVGNVIGGGSHGGGTDWQEFLLVPYA
ncbi:MAG: enolase, partial [Candidatus Aenigmatarchaeota archaeon]